MNNEENILETETIETEVLEDVQESTETGDDTETLTITDEEMIMKIYEALNAEDSAAVADPQVVDQGSVTAAESVAVDYTTQFDKINQSLVIIVMVLLFWFGAWMLRSWRTWTVKGGRK